MQVLSPGQPVSPNLPMPACACPANSPCQTVTVVVPYLFYISLAACIPALRPSSSAKNAPKIAPSLCNATPVESTLLQLFMLMNLKPFKINTGEKKVGWGPSWDAPSKSTKNDS